MFTAAEALQRLRAGNRRFADGRSDRRWLAGSRRREALVAGQAPWAIVLGCSDSRVPVELVFDCGPGDLFVIRVAGNIVAPSQVGSVEFAAERFGTRLVVVLGHSACGAVQATIEALRGDGAGSRNLMAIVDRIRPVVAPLLATPLADDPGRLLCEAVRANVMAACDHLRHGSAVLERLGAEAGLVVVGAHYDLERAAVDFFDLPPGLQRD